MESSQWPSFGLFAGISHHFGNWDECFKAQPLDFSSQYCLVSAKFNFTFDPALDDNAYQWDSWPNEENSAWDVLQQWSKDENRVSRQTLSWALCVPSSCRPPDVEIALNETLSPIFKKYGLTSSANVQPEFCHVEKAITLPLSFYITGAVVILNILWVLYCTFYESKCENDLPAKVKGITWTCAGFFSIRKNMKSLKTFSPENTFPIIHFFKILAAFFVLSGHRFMLFYFFPTFNTEKHEMIRKTFSFELLETNVVDIFITISGFLMFHYTYEPIRKGGLVYIFFYIIIRWLRMMCMPIVLILMMLFLMKPLHSGPYWNYYLSMHTGFCERNWWTTVFAINNIVEPDKPCLPQTWYLSVDIQLTILGAIILLIMSKNMKLGLLVCFGLVVVSSVVTWIIIVSQKYEGILKFTVNNAKNFVNVKDYHMLYVVSYNRVGGYILGLLASLLSKKLREKKYQFSSMATTVILVSSFIIAFGFNGYGFVFYQSHRPYDPLEHAAYGSFNRILFSLPFACLFCIYFTSPSSTGILNKLLDHKIYVPYGRLVYCAYLIGPSVQGLQVITQRSYFPVDNKLDGYWLVSADVLWVFVLALIAHLTVEAPVNNILKFGQNKLLKRVAG